MICRISRPPTSKNDIEYLYFPKIIKLKAIRWDSETSTGARGWMKVGWRQQHSPCTNSSALDRTLGKAMRARGVLSSKQNTVINREEFLTDDDGS